MNLWKRIACNPEVKQSMIQYYDEKGLADIRIYLAPWIEERIMSERINTPSTELYERIAHQFYEELKQKLIPLSNDNLMKFKLAEICTSVTQTPAVELYTHFRSGLQREIQLVDQMPQFSYMSGVGINGSGGGNAAMLGGGGIPVATAMHTPTIGSAVNGGNGYVGNDLYALHGLITKLNMDIGAVFTEMTQFRSNYETFHNCFNTYNQRKPHMSPQEIQTNDLQLQDQCRMLATTRSSILSDLDRIINTYTTIQTTVITELKNWQRNQALAGNGAPFRDNLDDIQRCIELLVEMVGRILENVNMMNMIRLDNNDDIGEMINRVRQAQQLLVLSSFIVEKQPPQVMKTNTRFAAGVRWLIGPQLGISVNSPTVECIILSEAQAQRHSAQRTMSESSSSNPASSGEIVNNMGTMEYNNQTRVFSASFRTMQLKKIKRAEKKGTESVMDEKFALLFYTSVIVNDYRIRVWTISLPVVVIVHGNQEPQSWATITWDNAFSDIVREPFQVPERVAWSQLAIALNTKFESSTGRALTEENLNFLHEKLFRRNGMNGDDDYISWAQFCKEPLPDRSFTFWDWFFAIMKLTKDHLLSLWKAGLIVGFINKRKAEEMLRILPLGTFLLRFSDSELGGITVGFVTEQSSVLMLSPWTARDLNIRGLADRIHDLEVLRFVYPSNRMRDEAFGEFYTQRMDENARRDGYVPNTIRVNVPAIEGVGGVTPQHNIQSPHPQDMQMGNDNNICLNDLDIYTNGMGMNDTAVDWDTLCIL
ncbi:signal transducer and transcription activator isoform X1 [Lucilia cuprina]|nr:signal transducer and transcription activator isoform X1 [Lucilia cuprina]XP_046803706.1 signal transducer and transcription activator isoform X1 [Lucilia cuprina]XP_046803708.1 signal transducer and transcription activator isoform X1 [Lucilia cuprina]KAI8130440.1 Signal transducer and transcription activator [Lucilia cuprina]